MPSPFQGIQIANTALQAFQRALDVTGHNVANVNTPGYSRQTVDFQELTPTIFYSLGAQALGNGVGIAAVNGIRSTFLEAQKVSSNSDLGNTNSLLSGSQQVQSLLNEPSANGINNALDSFYNAWSALASNPTEAGNKVQVQLAGETLANRVRGTYTNLKSLEASTTQSINQTLTDIQSEAGKIATLNDEIVKQSASGAIPNDLLDERAQAIANLSTLVDINTQTGKNGSVAVYINQFTLVDSGGARPLPRQFDTKASTLTDGVTTYDVRNGQLAGLFGQMNNVKGAESQLDNLANTLRTQVNSVHSTGMTGTGTTGQNFFGDVTPPTPQTGAINFDVDPAVKNNYQLIVSGTTGNHGDGGLALELSQQRDSAVAGLGGISITQYYNNTVTTVGRQVNYYQTQQSTQQALAAQVDQQIQSTSGVSLDEEMSSMLVFQRSYEAAAKSLTIADQVTQDLINMVHP